MSEANQQLECQRCGEEKPLDCYEAESGEQADLCDECFDEVFDEITTREHATPQCPNCGSYRTRPLDDAVATCFDCDDEWRL